MVEESFADPWPLAGSLKHLQSTATPPDELKVAPLERGNESVQTLRARLVYQSRKRGTLESDLLLSTFAQEWLPKMSEEQLKEFDEVSLHSYEICSHLNLQNQLLDEPDWDLYYWATNRRTPSERWAKTQVLQNLRTHAENKGKVVRRMPDL